MFSNPNIPVELNGNNIHRLENILTLSTELHAYFDDLYIWLKPVEVCSLLQPSQFRASTKWLSRTSQMSITSTGGVPSWDLMFQQL